MNMVWILTRPNGFGDYQGRAGGLAPPPAVPVVA